MRSALAALLVLASTAPAAAQLPFGPATPSSALAARGFVTDRRTAERTIAFRPFLADPPVEVALLPPFHGEHVASNEGIGYAYGPPGHRWLLQEWPRNGGSLGSFQPLAAAKPCSDVRAIGGNAEPRGVVWTTSRDVVMALSPEAGAVPRAVLAEFRRLVRRGACG
ncbi:MAG TPA: hypothetical protein VGX96_03200 [Candidatus Elarobacter sp.]|jgi:hypothetical protein|nr:hypothetical protein [Candidatus Elarobacter sp.]